MSLCEVFPVHSSSSTFFFFLFFFSWQCISCRCVSRFWHSRISRDFESASWVWYSFFHWCHFCSFSFLQHCCCSSININWCCRLRRITIITDSYCKLIFPFSVVVTVHPSLLLLYFLSTNKDRNRSDVGKKSCCKELLNYNSSISGNDNEEANAVSSSSSSNGHNNTPTGNNVNNGSVSNGASFDETRTPTLTPREAGSLDLTPTAEVSFITWKARHQICWT